MYHFKELEIRMPYIPEISVNAAYNKGDPRQGHKSEVDVWLLALKTMLNGQLHYNHRKVDKNAGVQLDVQLYVKRKPGRKPDTSNFRKIPQDMIAACLGVDDWIFSGRDLPLQEGNDEIVFTIMWHHSSNGKDPLDLAQSKLHAGPLNASSRKIMGLGKGTFCVGLGSAYCMKCDAVVECTQPFSPKDIPCKACKIVCPCRTLNKEREQLIEAWWSRRV